jgi:hypothetical protein
MRQILYLFDLSDVSKQKLKASIRSQINIIFLGNKNLEATKKGLMKKKAIHVIEVAATSLY